MHQQDDPRLDLIEDQVESYASTFRWIWWFNLAAAVWGALNGHREVAVVAGITALMAIIGVGLVRRGLKSIARAIARCSDIRKSRLKA